MTPPVMRLSIWSELNLVVAGVVGGLMCGCATPRLDSPEVSADTWQIRRGQALWQPEGETGPIGGELIVAYNRQGAFLVEFSKPPLTLVKAFSTERGWQVEWGAADRVQSGEGSLSERWLWLHLSRCLQGNEPPKGYRFIPLASDRWRLENRRTGAFLEGYLEP